MKKKPLLIGLGGLLLLVIILIFSARDPWFRMAQSPEVDMAYMEEAMVAQAPAERAPGSQVGAADGSEKIIRTLHYEIRSKSFDEDLPFFQAIADRFGGRIESIDQGANRSGDQRYFHVSYRIPTEKLSEFMEELEADRAIFHKFYHQYEVTDSYNQTAARLKTLQASEERYLALLEQAEAIEDIIAIEGALSNVQSEIEWLSQTKDGYDRDIDYTAVQVELNEVKASETLAGQTGFLAEIKDAFVTGINFFLTGLRNLVLWLVSLWPLVILLGLGLGVYWLRRKRNKPEE